VPKQCPKCGRLWDESDRFCGNCGEVLRAAPRVPRPAEPALPPAVLWLMDLCPGLFKPVVLVFSLAGIALALVAFWLSLFMIQMGGLIAAFAIGGGGVMVYWMSLSWLLYGYIVVPVEAMSEFQGKHWTALVLATLVPGALFLLLMKMASSGQ